MAILQTLLKENPKIEISFWKYPNNRGPKIKNQYLKNPKLNYYKAYWRNIPKLNFFRKNLKDRGPLCLGRSHVTRAGQNGSPSLGPNPTGPENRHVVTIPSFRQIYANHPRHMSFFTHLGFFSHTFAGGGGDGGPIKL